MGTTEEIVIDGTKVIAFFEKFVTGDKRGYVYKSDHISCVNFELKDGDKRVPSCIVGHFLDSIGLSYEDCNNGSVEMTVEELSNSRPEFKFTRTAILMLAVAQAIQDAGGTWGSSFDAADRVYDTTRRLDASSIRSNVVDGV